MKRFFCFALTVLLILSNIVGLISCNERSQDTVDSEADAYTESTEVTDSGMSGIKDNTNGTDQPDLPTEEDKDIETVVIPTAIVENGAPLYSIVYPQNASADVMNTVFNLWNAIYSLTGANLPMLNERDADADGNTRYILVGNTAFSETESAMAELSQVADGYLIAEKGSHIVFAAKSDADLQYAVTHYSRECLDGYETERRTLYFKGTALEAEPDFKGFDMSQISRYSIIYSETPQGLYSAAKLLQTEINSKTGIMLPIYADSQKNAGHYEILVGNTNRKLSGEAYSKAAYLMQYRIFVSGASLQIACGGAFSSRKGVEQFADEFLSGRLGEVLSEGSHGALASVLAPTVIAPVEGTTVRIMTLNIMPERLGIQKYPNVLSVDERAEIFAGMLLCYTPDVIGLQETCDVWEAQMPYYLDLVRDRYGIDYGIVFASYNGMNNYCPIIYREDKYTLDFAKYEPYDYDLKKALERGYYIRGASQIKLTEKGTSTTFIVVNSHWDHGGGTSTNPTNPQYTQYCADNEAAIVNGYKLQYPDVRIFMTGDFNNHRPHIATVLSEFLVTVNGSISSDLAREAGTLIVKGGYQSNDNYLIDEDVPRAEITTHTNDFIDHVVGTNGDFKVLRHDTILVNYCHVLTDHMPVYADIQFC